MTCEWGLPDFHGCTMVIWKDVLVCRHCTDAVGRARGGGFYLLSMVRRAELLILFLQCIHKFGKISKEKKYKMPKKPRPGTPRFQNLNPNFPKTTHPPTAMEVHSFHEGHPATS